MKRERHYNTRIMEVDQHSLTPIVFTVAGGIESEGRAFYSRPATLLSLKKVIEKSKVMSWIQSKVNFALLRSMLLCFRGSRQKLVDKKLDIDLEHTSIKNNWSKLLCKPQLWNEMPTNVPVWLHFRSNRLTLGLPQHTIFSAADWNNNTTSSVPPVNWWKFFQAHIASCPNVNHVVDSYDLPNLFLLT